MLMFINKIIIIKNNMHNAYNKQSVITIRLTLIHNNNCKQVY